MPTGLEIAALGVMAAGAAVSAASSIASGYQQKQAHDYNARVAEMHATASEDAARLEEESSRIRTKRLQGTVRARAGASGLSIADGSPLEVLAANASEGEFEALLARYGGAVEASRARSSAQMSRHQGRQAVIGGWMGAGAQLLQSAGGAYRIAGPSRPASTGFDSAAAARRAGLTWRAGEGW